MGERSRLQVVAVRLCFPLTGLLWRLTQSELPRLLRLPSPTFAEATRRLWPTAWPLLAGAAKAVSG